MKKYLFSFCIIILIAFLGVNNWFSGIGCGEIKKISADEEIVDELRAWVAANNNNEELLELAGLSGVLQLYLVDYDTGIDWEKLGFSEERVVVAFHGDGRFSEPLLDWSKVRSVSFGNNMRNRLYIVLGEFENFEPPIAYSEFKKIDQGAAISCKSKD